MRQALKKTTRLCLTRCGQTIFQAGSRVESSAGSPLTPKGVEDVLAAASEMSAQRIEAIYCSAGEGEAQTAELLAGALGVKVRTQQDLREVDFGLWQGLTIAEIKRRQPKMFRQWNAAPTTVRPPGGETLDQARQRLRRAVGAILKKHRTRSTLIVLAPVALELVLCMLSGDDADTIWRRADPDFTWSSYEMNSHRL